MHSMPRVEQLGHKSRGKVKFIFLYFISPKEIMASPTVYSLEFNWFSIDSMTPDIVDCMCVSCLHGMLVNLEL